MRRASPLLTSMPGTRVLDAQVYIGGHHLLPVKVNHQLTLAGIEGATCLADPETSNLPCGDACAGEVADRWRRPRYLTRRGNLRHWKYPHPWLPPIPAASLPHEGVRWSRVFSACDDLSPKDGASLLADDNEDLTQGLRKRIWLRSHPGRVTGVNSRLRTRLLSIPMSKRTASRQLSGRGKSGVPVLGSRRKVPTGRLANRGYRPTCLCWACLTLDLLEALHWRDVSQLLQQSEVTQGR
jgi:hypothetical protein